MKEEDKNNKVISIILDQLTIMGICSLMYGAIYLILELYDWNSHQSILFGYDLTSSPMGLENMLILYNWALYIFICFHSFILGIIFLFITIIHFFEKIKHILREDL